MQATTRGRLAGTVRIAIRLRGVVRVGGTVQALVHGRGRVGAVLGAAALELVGDI